MMVAERVAEAPIGLRIGEQFVPHGGPRVGLIEGSVAVRVRIAAAEAEELRERFDARLVPGTFGAVTDLLRSQQVQVIHISAHAFFDPILSKIMLEDGPLLPTDVRTMTIAFSNRPIIFLNTDEIGGQGMALTQLGGWANTFCDLGCTAVVAPFWSINDRVAKKAALLFYGQLRAGKTIGQSAQELRRRFWTDDEYRYDPTWLSYSVHGNPTVTVRFAGRDGLAIGQEASS